MTGKEFMNTVANGRMDILEILLSILEHTRSEYCVIGGLAVNAYAEPVVSLDIDLIVATEKMDAVCEAAKAKGFTVHRFEHSVNLSCAESDLRIQLQTDSRYQEFISRSGVSQVLGYTMRVADLEDVLKGKVWAYLDETRRRSKRQKDLADIIRIIETYPALEERLPACLRKEIQRGMTNDRSAQ